MRLDMDYFFKKLEIVLRKMADLHSQKSIASNSMLWKSLQSYHAKTKSTGCSYIDYYQLYKHKG